MQQYANMHGGTKWTRTTRQTQKQFGENKWYLIEEIKWSNHSITLSYTTAVDRHFHFNWQSSNKKIASLIVYTRLKSSSDIKSPTDTTLVAVLTFKSTATKKSSGLGLNFVTKDIFFKLKNVGNVHISHYICIKLKSENDAKLSMLSLWSPICNTSVLGTWTSAMGAFSSSPIGSYLFPITNKVYF